MNTMSETDVASKWEIASTRKMASYSFGFVILQYLASAFTISVFYFYEVEIGLPIDLLGLAFWARISDLCNLEYDKLPSTGLFD